MPRSPLLKAVAVSTALGTLNHFTTEHLYPYALSTFDPDMQTPDKGSRNFWKRKDYYYKEFLGWILIIAIVNTMRYVWFIWLERILPTRPRPTLESTHHRSQSRDNEIEEEKIVAAWIAQGRVRRSSVAWCNIFGKVLLDLLIGNTAGAAVVELMQRLLRIQTHEHFFDEYIFTTLTMSAFQLFSLTPLVSLFSFIIVPAHQRVVYEDAFWLFFNTSFAALIAKVGPWLMTLEFVKEILKNQELANNGTLTNSTLIAAGEL